MVVLFLMLGWEGNYTPTAVGPATAIRLGGRHGDAYYNHCVIENNVWELDEKSELLLFKGNDVSGVNQDRIRLLSNEIRFDTYNSAVNMDTTNVRTSHGNVFNENVNQSSWQ